MGRQNHATWTVQVAVRGEEVQAEPPPPALPLFFLSGLYHFGLFSEGHLLTYVQIWLHVFTPLEDLNIEEINIYFFINGKTHPKPTKCRKTYLLYWECWWKRHPIWTISHTVYDKKYFLRSSSFFAFYSFVKGSVATILKRNIHIHVRRKVRKMSFKEQLASISNLAKNPLFKNTFPCKLYRNYNHIVNNLYISFYLFCFLCQGKNVHTV